MPNKNIVVYTDGSCSNNGQKDAIGGIGIHFPNGELSDVSKVYRLGHCTNQRTELYAILSALRYIKQNLGLSKYQIHIKTDSQYSIDCITKWVYGWIKNGWMTKADKPVSNKEFIEKIHYYYEKYDIIFEHVEAHTGMQDKDSIANQHADDLATQATARAKSQLAGEKHDNTNTKRNRKSSPSNEFVLVFDNNGDLNKQNGNMQNNNMQKSNTMQRNKPFSRRKYTPASRKKYNDDNIVIELVND